MVALTAHVQQTFVEACRQIQFAAVSMIARLPIGNVKVLLRGTELFPQLSCPGEGMASFRRSLAFDEPQYRAQGCAEFELLSAIVGAVRQPL